MFLILGWGTELVRRQQVLQGDKGDGLSWSNDHVLCTWSHFALAAVPMRYCWETDLAKLSDLLKVMHLGCGIAWRFSRVLTPNRHFLSSPILHSSRGTMGLRLEQPQKGGGQFSKPGKEDSHCPHVVWRVPERRKILFFLPHLPQCFEILACTSLRWRLGVVPPRAIPNEVVGRGTLPTPPGHLCSDTFQLLQQPRCWVWAVNLRALCFSFSLAWLSLPLGEEGG